MPNARSIPVALALTVAVAAQADNASQALHALATADENHQAALDRLLAMGATAIPTLTNVMMQGAVPAVDSDTIEQELLQNVHRVFPLDQDRLLPKESWLSREPLAGIELVTSAGLPGEFRTQQIAAWVLGQIGDQDAIRALFAATQQSELQLRSQAVIELGRCGAVADLAHSLHQPYSGRLAGIQLSRLGEAGATALEQALSREDLLTTVHAMQGIAQLPDGQKIRLLPRVASFLNSESDLEAALATWVLISADRIAIPILLQALADGSVQTRWRATGVVGQLGEDGAPTWPLIIDGIADEDATVSAWSLHVAGHVGFGLRDAMAAFVPVTKVLRDESAALRIAALETAQRLGARHQPLADRAIEIAEQVFREDPDEDARLRALGALGTFPPDERILGLLADALHEDLAAVQTKAALVLGHYGPEAHATVPALLRGLQSPHNRVRAAAARTLGRIGALEALSALEVAARDPVRPVADHARLAIERIEAIHEDK